MFGAIFSSIVARKASRSRYGQWLPLAYAFSSRGRRGAGGARFRKAPLALAAGAVIFNEVRKRRAHRSIQIAEPVSQP